MSLLRSHSVEEKGKKSRFSFLRRLSAASASGSKGLIAPDASSLSPVDSGYSSSQADTREQNGSRVSSERSRPTAISYPPYEGLRRNSSPANRLSTNITIPSPPLYQVPEHTLPILRRNSHQDGLPTYSSSAQISGPVVLQFVRCSPFAMVVTEDLGGVSHPETGTKYHISVGVNIWMPNCTVTTIRRGPTEDGRLVAQLELGIMAGPATVTMAGQCRPLSSIMHRKSSSSSSRTYDLLDGRSLKWKLHSDAWRAYINSQEIASFDPTPPRKLILLPTAHRFTDHIIVCLVILMREHLTPKTGLVGDASQLFNYSPYFHTGDD